MYADELLAQRTPPLCDGPVDRYRFRVWRNHRDALQTVETRNGYVCPKCRQHIDVLWIRVL